MSYRHVIIFLIISAVGGSLSCQPVLAQEKYLTRAEVAVMLSTTDFVTKKIGNLFNWAAGYDISKINRTNLAPSIKYLKAIPVEVAADGRTILTLEAAVGDPGGLRNIKGVRADLSSIGMLPNTVLVDNGQWGDKNAYDGIYTLQTNVKLGVSPGEKEITVAAAKEKGWLTLGRLTLAVGAEEAHPER